MREAKIRYLLFPVLVTCSGLFLNSCSIVPQENYAMRVEQDVQRAADWSLQENAKEVTSLKELISAPELDTLIEEALNANPNLQQTVLALKITQAQRRQATGERLPEVAFDAYAEKEEGKDESFSGSLRISWELDLWKKLADNESAAMIDEREQQALLEAARTSLVGQVMTEWLGLTHDQRTIDIEELRLVNLEKNELYIMQRYRNGIGTLEDLDNARTSTAVSRASLVAYKESLAQRQRVLKTLLGRIGTENLAIKSLYPEVLTPLADLPEQTLQRRPDLQAAYFAIESANLRTSVAYKDLLPSISLEAALGDIGDSPGSMLLTDPVWALLGQLTAPLFQGGKLRAEAEIAELTTAQSFEVYRETLLEAISEVENALSFEQSITARQQHITSALSSARNSLERYQESYRSGLVDILDLLIIQEKTFDLAAQLDNLIYERLANRIDLGLALGLGV